MRSGANRHSSTNSAIIEPASPLALVPAPYLYSAHRCPSTLASQPSDRNRDLFRNHNRATAREPIALGSPNPIHHTELDQVVTAHDTRPRTHARFAARTFLAYSNIRPHALVLCSSPPKEPRRPRLNMTLNSAGALGDSPLGHFKPGRAYNRASNRDAGDSQTSPPKRRALPKRYDRLWIVSPRLREGFSRTKKNNQPAPSRSVVIVMPLEILGHEMP
jgi:hypothetical protein